MDDTENDPMNTAGRPSRSRRARTPGTMASIGGREREFPTNNGVVDSMSAAVSGAVADASNVTEETEALLKKLRNL